MAASEETIDRFLNRLQVVLAVKYALAGLTVWGFGWGLVVLLLRAGLGRGIGPAAWCLTGLAPIAIATWWLVKRRVPARAEVRALIDSSSQAGGLLMAEAESPLGGWASRLPALQAPRIHWQAKPAVVACLLALVFLGASHLIPKRFIDATTHHELDIAADVEELEAQLEILEDEQIVPEKDVEELEKQLTTVQESALGMDPVKTWEALDHLQETVDQKAEMAGEAAIGDMAKMTEAELLAEALQEGLGAEALDGMASKELASMMEELLKAHPELAGKLDAETMSGLQSGSLTKEQLAALKQALKEGKLGIEKKMGRLVDAKMLDPSKLAQCKKAGEGDSEGLVAFLAQASKDGASLAEAMAAYCDGAGNGGVSRGPGHAALNPGAPTSEEGVNFKEEVLPTAGISSLEKSELVGMTLGTPDGDSPELSRGSAIRGSQAGSGSSHTQRILPRHRATIERYFERE